MLASIRQTGFLRYFFCFFFQWNLRGWEFPHSQPFPVFWSQFKRLISRNKLCLLPRWRHLVDTDFISAFTKGFSNSCINSDGISWPWTYLQLHITLWELQLFQVKRIADVTVLTNGSSYKVQGVWKEAAPKKVTTRMFQEEGPQNRLFWCSNSTTDTCHVYLP